MKQRAVVEVLAALESEHLQLGWGCACAAIAAPAVVRIPTWGLFRESNRVSAVCHAASSASAE